MGKEDSVGRIYAAYDEAEICVECLVCRRSVPIGPAWAYHYPVVKICEECRRRLVRALYSDGGSDNP